MKLKSRITMNKKRKKDLLYFLIAFIILFIIPWFYRKYRDSNIEKNKLYVIGTITTLRGSFKSASKYYFDYYYNNTKYEGSQSINLDYNINIGDCFIVELSSENHKYNKILYEHKIKKDSCVGNLKNVWKEFPYPIVIRTK